MDALRRGALGTLAVVLLALAALLPASPAAATITAYTEPEASGPLAVATAMMAAGTASQLTGATWLEYPVILPPGTPCPAPGGLGDPGPVDANPSPAGVSNDQVTALFGLPDANGLGILSSGFAADAIDDIEPSRCDGSEARGAFDVVILRVDLLVPSGHNCVGFAFQFLSAEFPTWVGTQYNDAFIAELGASTWELNGATINAPGNFAFVTPGVPATVNSLGFAGMSAWRAFPTPYGGASDPLQAKSPITPGPHSMFLSIFDAGDMILDSAVLVDRLGSWYVPDPDVDCVAGISYPPDPTVPVYRLEASVTFVGCSSSTFFMYDASWPAPDALDWVWDFGDGATGHGQSVEHEYTTEGWYRVTLTIPDGTEEHVASAMINVRFGSCETVGPPELDSDWDGVPDSADNCPGISNRDQSDVDADGIGDACAETCDGAAGCRTTAGPPAPRSQAAHRDQDLDGVPDARDACATTPDADQANLDGDLYGDACDSDADGDGVLDRSAAGLFADNCPGTPNPSQADADEDGLGDACDVAGSLYPGTFDGVADADLGGATRPSAAAPWITLAVALAALAWPGRRRIEEAHAQAPPDPHPTL